MIQYAAPFRLYLRCQRLLDAPLEPVIGLAEGETRWRGMTRKAYLRHRFLGLFRALALVGIEVTLAQADRFRRDRDQFIVLDIGQRLFEGHADRRGQPHRFILRGGADVGELLALEDVDLKVVVAGMLANDHALVDLPAGLDHHRTTIFQLEHRISHRLALIVGDQDAVAAALDVALVGQVIVEQAVHDRRALGVGHQLALIADQAAGRRVEHQPQAVAAGWTHLDHLGLALAHLLHDDTGEFLVDVDDDFLDRLQQLAVLVLGQHHARTRHRQLEAFAAHGLDQDRELQFAAPRHFHRIPVGGLDHAQRHVAFGFAQQAITDQAAGDLVACGTGKRRVVDDERHRHRRRIDRLGLDRHVNAGIAEGVGHGALGQARDGDDIAGFSQFDRLAFKTTEGEDLGDAAGFNHLAVARQHLHRLVRLDRTGSDAAGDDAAEIGVGLENGAEQAVRAFLDHGRRHMFDDEVEQRLHADVVRGVRRRSHPAVLARPVQDRKVELIIGRVERGEQVEHLVDDFGDAGIRAVDLVDGDDRLEAQLERLADHEFGLWHRTFGGVDQNDDAIDHRQDTLDLTAEIGVARRVDDVDLGVFPMHRGALGENGDAALALQIVGVHGALDLSLVVAIGAGLLQQFVDERGLAVVDVGDDSDVAKVHSCSSASDNGWSAISPENRDPLFRITLKNLEFEKAQGAQKGSPAKRTGRTLLVAAQYSQKSPKNNALFAIWLADFRPSRPENLSKVSGYGPLPPDIPRAALPRSGF